MPNSFSAIKKAIFSLDWLDFPCKACRVKRPSKSSSLTNKSEKKSCFQQICFCDKSFDHTLLRTHYFKNRIFVRKFALKNHLSGEKSHNRNSLISKSFVKFTFFKVFYGFDFWTKNVGLKQLTLPGFRAEMRATKARPSRHEEPKFSTWMPNLGVIISLHHCNKAFLAPTFQPLDLRLGSETADECWPWESEYICFVFSSICKV